MLWLSIAYFGVGSVTCTDCFSSVAELTPFGK